MTSRHRWRLRACMLVMLYFTFIGGTFLTDQRLWPRIIHHALVTVGLLIWLMPGLWGRRWLPSTHLDYPLAALFAVYTLAVVFAVDPRVSLEFLWVGGVHILLFYAVVSVMRAWKPRMILEPLFFAASVVVLVGTYEFISWYFGLGLVPGHNLNWLQIGGVTHPVPPKIYRLALTLGVSTNLSGYIALLIPVAVSWAIATTKRQTRQMIVFWLVPAFMVEILTFSRGGLLALGASLSLCVLGTLLSSPVWRDRLRLLISDRRFQIPSLVVVLVVIVLALVGATHDSGQHEAGDALRFDLWRSAWIIGQEHPLTGVGPGGFGRAVRDVRDSRIAEDRLTSPHDIPLLIFAEAGLPGVGVLVWLIVAVGVTALHRWQDAENDRDKLRIMGAFAALVGFAVQNIFDTLTMTPNLLPVMILAGYLVYPYVPTAPMNVMVSKWTTRVVAVLVLVSGVGWVISDRAQWYFDQAVRYQLQGDYESALAAIDKAHDIDPNMGYYLAQRAQILGEMSLYDPNALPDALEAYQQFLEVEDSYDIIHANYAQLLVMDGELDQAQNQLHTAALIYPRNPQYALWEGTLAEQQEDFDAAANAYQMAVESSPHWVTSTFWEQTEFRREWRTAWLTANGFSDEDLSDLASISENCWPLLSDGVVSNNQALCEGEVAFRLASDYQTALAAYDRAVDEMPPGIVAWAYLGRSEVYLQMGKTAEAEKDALTALFLGDRRANTVMGTISEQRGELDQAVDYYAEGGPLIVQYVGWDVAVYARIGNVLLFDSLDAPGPSRYDFAAWLALIDLYERQGAVDKADEVRDRILALDPYFQFSAGQ